MVRRNKICLSKDNGCGKRKKDATGGSGHKKEMWEKCGSAWNQFSGRGYSPEQEQSDWRAQSLRIILWVVIFDIYTRYGVYYRKYITK